MKHLKGNDLKKGIGLATYTPKEIAIAQKAFKKLGVKNAGEKYNKLTNGN